MKITDSDYAHLKGLIMPNKDKIAGHREFIIKEGKAKDIEKRLRWDLFYASGATRWACDTLYKYLNDDHLDTALRSIVKEIS